jgi:Spy/CpxP family protein refolding chaperone
MSAADECKFCNGAGSQSKKSPNCRRKRWQTQLSLTDEQTANVKALFTERDKKVMELRKNSGTDKEAMKKGGKEIRENTEAALLKIFTPEQKDKYTKIREERKEQKIKGRLDKK